MLKDVLTPYVEHNEDLTYVVTEEIYADVCDEVVSEARFEEEPAPAPPKPAAAVKAAPAVKPVVTVAERQQPEAPKRGGSSAVRSQATKKAGTVDARLAWSAFVKSEVSRPFVDVEEDTPEPDAAQKQATPSESVKPPPTATANVAKAVVSKRAELEAPPTPVAQESSVTQEAASEPERPLQFKVVDAFTKLDHDQASTAVDSSGE